MTCSSAFWVPAAAAPCALLARLNAALLLPAWMRLTSSCYSKTHQVKHKQVYCDFFVALPVGFPPFPAGEGGEAAAPAAGGGDTASISSAVCCQEAPSVLISSTAPSVSRLRCRKRLRCRSPSVSICGPPCHRPSRSNPPGNRGVLFEKQQGSIGRVLHKSSPGFEVHIVMWLGGIPPIPQLVLQLGWMKKALYPNWAMFEQGEWNLPKNRARYSWPTAPFCVRKSSNYWSTSIWNYVVMEGRGNWKRSWISHSMSEHDIILCFNLTILQQTKRI